MSARRLVVVGGVAGGASCAARARRLDEKAKIIIFEKGPDPSFANCGMPYYIGGEIQRREALNVQTPQSLLRRLNLDVRCLSEVTAIDRAAKKVTVKDYAKGTTYQEEYDDLVLSTGAMPFKPPIPGIDRPGNISLRNLQDMDKIDNWIKSTAVPCSLVPKQRAVVAGAGFIGIEMAEQLKRRGLEVTIVEAMPQIMAPLDEEMAAMLQAELEKKGVRVITDNGIASFEEATDGAHGSDVILSKSGERLHADIVILGLGVRPDTQIAAACGLKLGARGGIIVDDYMRTEDPNVWAVGDAVEVKNPTLGDSWMVAMAGPANRQGRLCADNIFGQTKRKYKGTLGTSVLRCFDLTCACTGVNERAVKAKGLKYKAFHISPRSHAGYYPGAAALWLKLIFNPEDGKIYGAQAVGADLVEKRIDVIATAMFGKMTIDDLAELELCYAPPFGSAKDPVNYAGMVAQNIRDGDVEVAAWDEVPALLKRPDIFFLDVRTPRENKENGNIAKDALNIEVDVLRSRMDELPKDKTLLVHCCSGLRSYYACRMLKHSGFKCINVSGGYQLWKQHAQKKFGPL